MMFSGVSGDGESLSERMAMLVGIPIQMSPAPGEEMAVAGGGGEAPLPRRGTEERLPQWGQQETRDLITIKADLERDPSSARRNRTPWEVVTARMSDRGYRRTPDQCKSKWKSLVNRYKGKETADPDAGGRQWPFFDELSVVFMEPEKEPPRIRTRFFPEEEEAKEAKQNPNFRRIRFMLKMEKLMYF